MSIVTAGGSNVAAGLAKYASLLRARANSGALSISTTGSPSTSNLTIDGVLYTLYTYTGAGTIVNNGSRNVQARTLVLGGGGSGGGSGGSGGNGSGGGGGGAAAFVDTWIVLNSATTYTIVVGGGGAAVTNQAGNLGSDSYIYTGNINVRHSYGGGKGAGYNNTSPNQQPTFGSAGAGGPGPAGSSGGACNGGSGNGMTAGTTYSPSGSAGATAAQASYGNGGGGGGAGSAPTNVATFGYVQGGDGRAWVNGTTYAGGGAGGWGTSTTPAPGGSGGGGSGAYNVSPAGSGTANTGSGGAGGWNSSQVTGAGGSGVVLIAIPVGG